MIVQKKIKVAFFTDILIKDLDGAIKTMYQLIDRIPEDRFEYMFFCGTPPKHEFKYNLFKVPSVVIPFNISYKLALHKGIYYLEPAHSLRISFNKFEKKRYWRSWMSLNLMLFIFPRLQYLVFSL